MMVLGLDMSLTSTGYAYVDRAGQYVTGRIRPKDLRGMERVTFIRDAVLEVLDEVAPTLVAYEGYAMGKFNGRILDRAELGGVLKLEFHYRKIPLLLVPPTSLKLFATGRGSGRGKEGKAEVMAAMARIRGRLFTSNDEADAFALLHMGIAHQNPRSLPRIATHHKRVALAGCELVEPSGG